MTGLPPARFASTTNAPSRPCGRPTRPTSTRSATEDGERFLAGRDPEDVLVGKLLREWPRGRPDPRGRRLDVVVRPPHLDTVEEPCEALVARQLGDPLRVAARNGMAEEDVAEDERLRQPFEPGGLVVVELLPDPGRTRGLVVGTVRVPANRVRSERADEGERLARQRPRRDVPSEDDLIDVLAFELAEHGLERRQVAVDVVQRCDAH